MVKVNTSPTRLSRAFLATGILGMMPIYHPASPRRAQKSKDTSLPAPPVVASVKMMLVTRRYPASETYLETRDPLANAAHERDEREEEMPDKGKEGAGFDIVEPVEGGIGDSGGRFLPPFGQAHKLCLLFELAGWIGGGGGGVEERRFGGATGALTSGEREERHCGRCREEEKYELGN
jgi:hypothetical protein